MYKRQWNLLKMPDMNLQQRIANYANEGYSFLGKDVGSITPEDYKHLHEAGLGKTWFAIYIDRLRYHARNHGVELDENASSYEVCEKIKDFTRPEQLIRESAFYHFSLYVLMTPQEQTMMELDWEDALADGIPHTKEIRLELANITEYFIQRSKRDTS